RRSPRRNDRTLRARRRPPRAPCPPLRTPRPPCWPWRGAMPRCRCRRRCWPPVRRGAGVRRVAPADRFEVFLRSPLRPGEPHARPRARLWPSRECCRKPLTRCSYLFSVHLDEPRCPDKYIGAEKFHSIRKSDVVGGKQMVEHNHGDDRERCREKGAERAPHPGPERQGKKYQERIERNPPADDRRRDEMPLRGGQRHKT